MPLGTEVRLDLKQKLAFRSNPQTPWPLGLLPPPSPKTTFPLYCGPFTVGSAMLETAKRPSLNGS